MSVPVHTNSESGIVYMSITRVCDQISHNQNTHKPLYCTSGELQRKIRNIF